MNIILAVLLSTFHLITYAQEDSLAFCKKMTQGKWVISKDGFGPLATGDTISMSRGARNKYPIKFKSDLTMKRMSTKRWNSCGTFGKFESLFTMKWKKDGNWTIGQALNGNLYISTQQGTFELIESNKMLFVFTPTEE